MTPTHVVRQAVIRPLAKLPVGIEPSSVHLQSNSLQGHCLAGRARGWNSVFRHLDVVVVDCGEADQLFGTENQDPIAEPAAPENPCARASENSDSATPDPDVVVGGVQFQANIHDDPASDLGAVRSAARVFSTCVTHEHLTRR